MANDLKIDPCSDLMATSMCAKFEKNRFSGPGCVLLTRNVPDAAADAAADAADGPRVPHSIHGGGYK